MVVHEALRLYPPVWGIFRIATEQLEIAGTRVPRGATLFVSPYTPSPLQILAQPRAFDPEHFRPNQPIAPRPRGSRSAPVATSASATTTPSPRSLPPSPPSPPPSASTPQKGDAGVGDERRLRHSQAHHRTARAAWYPWACARRPHHIGRRPRPFARSEQARGNGPVSRGWLPRGADPFSRAELTSNA
jgi:hypothetical protein